MIKIISLIVGVLVLSSFSAQAAGPVMQCLDPELYVPNEQGGGKFEPANLAVEIYSAAAPYGWKAEVVAGGQKFTVTDVQVTNATPNEATSWKDVLEGMAPQVKWETVRSLRIGNVGVEANQQDSGGMFVVEFQGQNSAVLAKLFTMGWSFGRCGQ